MKRKSPDVLRRSDRVLIGALTVVLAVGSAAVGAAAAYRPHTDQSVTAPVAAAAVVADASAPELRGDADALGAPVAPLASLEATIKAKLLAEHKCLSEALYYEARGEGTSGQKAIAEVIFARLRSGNYGHSICSVVYEGAGKPKCQFSFACNGDMKKAKNKGPWMKAQQLAARILTGEEYLKGTTGGATNFHAVSVDPSWAAEMSRTTQIGNHIFYKGLPRSRSM